MKESRLIEMSNKVEALGRVAEHLARENQQLKIMVMGDHQVLKKMPGFDEAIAEMKEEQDKETTPLQDDSKPKFETD